MPLFNFYCIGCDKRFRRILKSKDEEVICGCGDHLKPELPSNLSTQTMELKDKNRGKSLPKGHAQSMKKRMSQHHDKYEVEAKIDEHGTIDAKKFGWDKKVKRV